jgi:hypothetical protein
VDFLGGLRNGTLEVAPSGMMVARKAKFLPSISLMAFAFNSAGNKITIRDSYPQEM